MSPLRANVRQTLLTGAHNGRMVETQQQVESLQQYLLPKAKRSFGLICSRTAPSESALKARRRAWMVSENIIHLPLGTACRPVRPRDHFK